VYIGYIILYFKVVGQGQRHMGFCVLFRVHDAVATRGQYLALSKAG